MQTCWKFRIHLHQWEHTYTCKETNTLQTQCCLYLSQAMVRGKHVHEEPNAQKYNLLSVYISQSTVCLLRSLDCVLIRCKSSHDPLHFLSTGSHNNWTLIEAYFLMFASILMLLTDLHSKHFIYIDIFIYNRGHWKENIHLWNTAKITCPSVIVFVW